MKSPKTFLFCLYLSIILNDILCIPNAAGGGKAGGSYTSGGRSNTRGFLGSPPKTSAKQPVGTNMSAEGDSASPKVTKTRGSFLSAWGIVSLILFVIVGSALTYYISIFYPLICAKRGKYDVMEMTAV